MAPRDRGTALRMASPTVRRANEPPAAAPDFGPLTSRSFAIIFCVSITITFGNTGMQSILPAIGRQIGMPDILIPAIFSLSALVWGFSSPYWARRSDATGRKPMMILGLLGFMVSMICCGLVVSAGLRHWAPILVIFLLFLLSRAIFGVFGSAANPASQAYVAERTTRQERTEQMAGLAGAVGLGTVTGPFVAQFFVLPVVSLAGPMFAFALIAAAMAGVVWRFLPEPPRAVRAPPTTERGLTPEPSRFEPRRQSSLWRDPRLTPFLIYGFLCASCQTVNGQSLGFLIIDKLHLPPMQALGFAQVAMGAGAISGLLAQWGLIRMFRMQPRHLVRWGAGLAALANLIIAFAPSYWAVVVGYALASLGYGFCRPGFTAGASLSVDADQQARAAGAIAAINGSSAVVAPVLGVWLYEQLHPAPYLLNMTILLSMLAFTLLNPVLRTVGSEPTTEDETTAAQFDRVEEGGGSV
jgi:MFS family permease